ncbi:MAG: acyl-CoA/acyl-ACP dehydrogenase [Azoarcus sp.]|nr:acyl-CoA/acyl-ACP dehydrogenase [Azoarcus sp.]
MNLAEAHANLDSPPRAHVLVEAVETVADDVVAKAATRVDREGYYPLAEMRALAEAGAFGAHLDRNGTDVATAIDAMRAINRRCGSTGFLAWCHDVCGLYMEQSGNPALSGQVLTDHVAGRTFGGTALSNPMKSFAGIENMLLKAEKVAGGYVVSGALPWVSHIAPGQYCGAIARVAKADGSRSHEIMFLLRLTDDVVLRTCPDFSGMEGTSTWGVRLERHFVGEDALIADPAQPFVARIRGAFILLQCGMAMGVAQGAIDSMLEVEPLLGHVNKFLHDRPAELQGEYEELGERIFRLAETPYDGSKDYLLDVLDVRAAGAEFCLRATQSALLHQGARGYLMDSAPQRRIREAHFVAIVTPAIKHLRWEMDRLSREEMPA